MLKYNKAGELSIYKFAMPVLGAILSAMFILGEQLTLFIIGEFLLVVVGFVEIKYRLKERDTTKAKT